MSLVFIDSGLSVEYTNLFWVYNLLQETETKEMMIVQCNVAQIHMHMYYMRSLQKVSRHLTWKLDAFIEEDTRYRNIVHRTMAPQSCSNSSTYINNGWTFSRQTSYNIGYYIKYIMNTKMYLFISLPRVEERLGKEGFQWGLKLN